MDKKFISIDKQKIYFKVFNIVCIGLLFLIIVLFAFINLLPRWFIDVCFWCWVAFLVFYLISDLIFYLKIKKNIKEALKSKYLFDRNIIPNQIQTKFIDCITQEVEFFEKYFNLNGENISYDQVKLEYSIYGDNIMFHIYKKDEDANPLLVFIVTKEMYYMIKKFNLNVELIDKEIDVLNLNNR